MLSDVGLCSEPKPCCLSCAKGLPCEGGTKKGCSDDFENKEPCCQSCAYGLPCEGASRKECSCEFKSTEPCCQSCAQGLPCEGDSGSHDRKYQCSMFRNMYMRRAGVPTREDQPDLDEAFCSDPGKVANAGKDALDLKRYRRQYNYENEPYFFAKENSIPFCHVHVSPWSEDGYYYYKGQHEASKVEGNALY